LLFLPHLALRFRLGEVTRKWQFGSPPSTPNFCFVFFLVCNFFALELLQKISSLSRCVLRFCLTFSAGLFFIFLPPFRSSHLAACHLFLEIPRARVLMFHWTALVLLRRSRLWGPPSFSLFLFSFFSSGLPALLTNLIALSCSVLREAVLRCSSLFPLALFLSYRRCLLCFLILSSQKANPSVLNDYV